MKKKKSPVKTPTLVTSKTPVPCEACKKEYICIRPKSSQKAPWLCPTCAIRLTVLVMELYREDHK